MDKFSLRENPFIRLLIAFIAGLIVYSFVSLSVSQNVLLILLLAFLLLIIPVKLLSYRLRFIRILPVLLFFFTAGFYLYSTANKSNVPEHFSKHTSTQLVVKVDMIRKSTAKSVRFRAKVIAAGQEPVSGNLLITLKHNQNNSPIHEGDTLLIPGKYYPIQAALNPGMFDYKAYLSRQHIYHQVILNHVDILKLNSEQEFNIRLIATNLRNECYRIYEQYIPNDKNRNLLAALVLGDRRELDQEIVSTYSQTGVMHLLSVSGLHVAIVYLVLNFLLSFLSKFPSGLLIKNIFLLTGVWFYALLTGLSPAVVRAAIMISFIITGSSLSRTAGVYNVIAASAFIMLFIDPYLIHDIGFQLSYLAVVGIIYLQPLISEWYTPNYWITEQLWAIITVSIAAQVSTAPLTIYYFHQFANCFLPANMIMIPAATLVLYGGLLLLVLFPIAKIAGLIAWFLVELMNWMNRLLLFIEQLPYASVNSLSISFIEMLLWYAVVVVLVAYLFYQNRKAVFTLLCLLIIISTINLYNQFKTLHQKQIVIYSIRNETVIDFMQGTKAICIADSTILEKNIAFNIQPCRVQNGIKNISIISPESEYSSHQLRLNKGLIQFYNQTIFLADKHSQWYYPKEADIVLVNAYDKISISRLLEKCKIKTLIIKGFYSEKAWNWLERTCNLKKVELYSLNEKGAYVIKGLQRSHQFIAINKLIEKDSVGVSYICAR